MAAKMITIAARVPHEDAEFISQLKVEGAKTPSDKVRAIIAEARKRSQSSDDYRYCLEQVRALLDPCDADVRQREIELGLHSELVSRAIEWLPDTMAYIMSNSPVVSNHSADSLYSLEQGLGDRLFRMIEAVLQMAVTRRLPCYDGSVITENIEPVLDLAHVIESARARIKEE